MGVKGDMSSGAGETGPAASSDGDVDFSAIESLDSGGDYGELSAGNDAPGADAPVDAKAQKDSSPASTPAPGTKEAAAEDKTKSSETTQTPPGPGQEQKVEPAAAASQPKDAATRAAETAGGGEAPSELDSFLSDITQNEQAFISALAEKDFKLSPEMVQALVDGQGETVVPRIVAGGALWAVRSMSNIMKTVVPKMIEKEVARITQEADYRKTSEERFFAKWPQLSKDKHFDDISKISHAFKQANPKISFDELVALTGAAVMAKHGIVAQAAVQPPSQAPKQAPFVPANGGRVIAASAVDADNPFAGAMLEYND